MRPIIPVSCNRPIADARHNLINYSEGNEKPLARFHRVAKAIVDREIERSPGEHLMDQTFKLRPVDVEQLVSRNNIDPGQQICR